MDLRVKPLTGEEILMRELPELEWVVDGLIAVKDRVVLFGEFGSGKSWVGQHLGLCIAAGRPWLGFPILKARGVLYVDEEMPTVTSHRRVKRLMWGLHMTSPPPFWLVSRGSCHFKEGGAQSLLDWMRVNKVEADVIFLDAMRRMVQGDENRAQDVIEFWRRVETLIRAGKTVIVLHHMNKPPSEGNREARHRASGSTDILAGCDTAYSLSGDGTGGYLSIAGEKSRNMEKDKGFLVQWTDHGDREGPMYVNLVKDEHGGGKPDFGTWGSVVPAQVCT